MLGIFDHTFLTTSGGLAVAASATVEVRREDTGALASIFSDVDGALAINNPFSADANGRATFYADGLALGYKITATKGAEIITLRNVPIGTAGYLDAADLGVVPISDYMTGVVAAPDEASIKALLNLETGVDVQGHSASLDTLSSATITAAALTILDDSTVAAMRATLGISVYMTDVVAAADEASVKALLNLETGVDVQGHSANLDTLASATITAAALTVLDDSTVAAMRATLGIAGKIAIPIPAASMTPRSANGCATLAISNGAANQPDIPYLAFDGAAKEYACFYLRMPKSWNEGTVTAAFDWRRASGTGAANVLWGIRAVAVSDNETPITNFGTDATYTDAASTTTANFCLSGETGPCTIAGTPAEGDLVLFEVFRDGASGSDTLDGIDAWLTHVTLFITLNETNDA